MIIHRRKEYFKSYDQFSKSVKTRHVVTFKNVNFTMIIIEYYKNIIEIIYKPIGYIEKKLVVYNKYIYYKSLVRAIKNSKIYKKHYFNAI